VERLEVLTSFGGEERQCDVLLLFDDDVLLELDFYGRLLELQRQGSKIIT
jgi:hypothetical protein